MPDEEKGYFVILIDRDTSKIFYDSFEICNKLRIDIEEFIENAQKYNGYNNNGKCFFKIREDIDGFVFKYIDPKIVMKMLKNRH